MIPRLPKAAWAVLGGDALSALGTGMTLPFLLVYLHDVRGLSLALAGLAVSTVALISFVGNPLGGVLADRWGARTTLVGALVVAAAGAVLLLAVRHPWHAFVAATTVGLGASVAWPAQDTLLANLAGERYRSSVFAIRHATLNAGLGAGALVAALLVDTARPESFTVLYLVDAATFLAFIPLLLAIPDTRPHDADTATAAAPRFVDIARDRVFLRVWLLCAVVVTISYGQMYAAFPAYATRPGHISAGALGLAYAANAVTVVVAQLLVLRLLRGRRRTTAIALACGAWATTWGITLVAGQLGNATGAVLTFAAALTVFAFAETLLSPTFTAIVNDIAPDHLRGRYNGLSTLAWTSGFMVGPALAGAMLQAGLGTALFVGLIAACAAAAVAAGRLSGHLAPAANVID